MTPITIFIIGGALAFFLLIIGIGVSISSEKSMVEERLGRYTDEEKVEVSGDSENENRAPLTDWINRRVQRSTFGESVSRELARADIKLKPGEYVALMIISAFGVGLVAWFIGGRSIIVGGIGAVIGLFLPVLLCNP